MQARCQGTVADLTRDSTANARFAKRGMAHLEPATFDFTAEVVRDRVAIAGKLQQLVFSVKLTASMPFDIPKIARAKNCPTKHRSAKARLPRSPVNFVRQFFRSSRHWIGKWLGRRRKRNHRQSGLERAGTCESMSPDSQTRLFPRCTTDARLTSRRYRYAGRLRGKSRRRPF